jgi:hypothetical protein
MIQWQITTQGIFTGATYSAFSSSSTSTAFDTINRPFGEGRSAFFAEYSYSQEYTLLKSTSIGLDGTTTFSSSSGTSETYEASGLTYDGSTPEDQLTFGGLTTYTDSGSFSTSEAFTFGTANVETSTTISAERAFFVPVLSVEGEESFYTVESAITTYTYHATTTIGATQPVNGISATVVQAGPDEILYFIASPQAEWNGFLPASEAAQSGTRFTISPSYSTEQIQTVNTSITTSGQAVNALNSESIAYKRLTFVTRQQTAVDYARLPNGTHTFEEAIASTTQSTTNQTLFWPETFFLGRTNQETSSSRTTKTVVSYVQFLTTRTGQYGSVTHEDLQLTSTSGSIIVSDAVYGTGSSSKREATNTIGTSTAQTFSGSRQTESGFTYEIEGNTSVFGPNQITTNIGYPVSRTKFATTGVVLNGQTGLWLSANAQHTVVQDLLAPLMAGNGVGRGGNILFPQTNSQRTIEQNSLTYSTTTTKAADSVNSATSENTTSSMLLTLAGESYTIEDSLTNNKPRHHRGGPIGAGCTAVDVFDAGCYKDQIGGGTASFWGEAQVLTEGQSAPLKSWFPIAHIAPPVLRHERHGIAWAVPRNSATIPS